MKKIPDTAQAWADVVPHGKVFLRRYTSFAMIKIYRCVQEAASAVIPHLLEYYHFVAPLGEEGLMARLQGMGYPDNLYVAGLNEVSSAGQTFVAVTQYGGQPLNSVIRRLKEDGNLAGMKAVVRSLGNCFGTLHRAGLICDDTHPDQFVVDESFVVRRIDVHQSRVHMDIVPGHPIFGGINESFFEFRRLTQKGFDMGVRNELQGAMYLAQCLDKEYLLADEVTQECRNSYLGAGGTKEGWASGETALAEAAKQP